MLQMDRRPSPILRMHIRDRLRKGPRMPREVIRVVLPLPIGVSHGLLCNPRAASFSTSAVCISVLDANRDRMSDAQHPVGLVLTHFSHDDCSIAHVQLDAMVANAQTHGKSKRIAQPSRSLVHFRIRQNRNYGSARDGSVGNHRLSPLWLVKTKLDHRKAMNENIAIQEKLGGKRLSTRWKKCAANNTIGIQNESQKTSISGTRSAYASAEG